MFKNIISSFLIISFFVPGVLPYDNVFAQEDLNLPAVGGMVGLSQTFTPVLIKGLKLHRDNPFVFDFVVNQGQENLDETNFREESLTLVKYFLASLTIPEEDLWVNLSPFEKNRIITPEFGVTQMGKDLLSQDYILKQVTSSLVYPEGEIGKKFWAKVYAMANAKYHTSNVPINTFNKVWIVPEKAIVYENAANQTAYVLESKLKVMLEEDYLSMQKNLNNMIQPDIQSQTKVEIPTSIKNIQIMSQQIVREIIIPELTKEVNEGKNFANLRQITNSLILAAWFKRSLKESLLGKLYVDQKKVMGVDLKDKTIKERIFQQYLKAYKKGVYNYIKEDVDPTSHEIIPRKYFSGGYVFRSNMKISHFIPDGMQFYGDRNITVRFDRAMISEEGVRLATEEELKDPKRTLFTADGITRDKLYSFNQEDLPRKPIDVVFIGAGAAGLAGGIQAVDSNLRTVVLEGGYVAQSFSDAFMNFWRMRTPAFRFSLIQKGFNSLRLQKLNLVNPKVLSRFRTLALEASKRVNQVLGKNFLIAQPRGFDNLTNATVPLARAEAFQHFLEVTDAIVERGGFVRENDPVDFVKKREDGLFEVKTKKGITVITKNIVYATGLGNEQVAQILKRLADREQQKYKLISSPQEIPETGLVGIGRLPIFVSQILNDPRIVEYIRSLPVESSIGIVGGGQSAGNSAAYIHSINPDIKIHIFTKNKFKVHGAQMPAGFRKAHLMWEYVTDEGLRKDGWIKGGPEAVETPITPPIFNYISQALDKGTIEVHVLGKYFDESGFEVQTEGQKIRIIDKENHQEIAVINNGGFISAVGYSLQNSQRKSLYESARENGLIQFSESGLISINQEDGLTSLLNPHVYIAGIQLLKEGAVTDGSTHGAVVRARAIIEHIKKGDVQRLSNEERVKKVNEDYKRFIRFLDGTPEETTVAAFLTLAKSQAGETIRSVKSKYKRALGRNAPLEAARYVAEVAGQTGRDIDEDSKFVISELKKEEILKRILATDMPGYLEHQDGRNKIGELFDKILPLTRNDILATEQLLYSVTEYGVGEEKAIKIFEQLKGLYRSEIAAILVRAATSYLPIHENDAAMATTLLQDPKLKRITSPLNPVRWNPGGINLNTANLDFQVKRDVQGIPLPVEFQNLENIHINGLRPVIINVASISNLQAFLGSRRGLSDNVIGLNDNKENETYLL